MDRFQRGSVGHSISAHIERLLRKGGNLGGTRQQEAPLVDVGHPPGQWQLRHDGQRRRGDTCATDLCLRLPEADKMIAVEMFAGKKTNLSFTAAFNIIAREELETLHRCTYGGHGRC